MHNSSDRFRRDVLRDALSLAAITGTKVGVEALDATQKIDVYSVPDPAREAARPHLGLLGELAAVPSVFEPFGRMPTVQQIRACLLARQTWARELKRRAWVAAGSSPPDDDPEAPPPLVPAPVPVLVLITPERPEMMPEVFTHTESRPGVYDALEGLALRVVVLAELARTRETLILRLLGKGRVVRDALADFGALPEDAWEKRVVLPRMARLCLEPAKEPAGDGGG